MAADMGGMNDLALDQIVGDREQGADEDPIAFSALGKPCIALRGIGQRLGIKSTLGARGHDHRVFNALRLHQPENLGAEIVAPIGPAQSAARDRTSAQMNAFNARAVDKNLAPRQRRGQTGDARRIEFERERLGRGGSEHIGAQRRADRRAEQPQDAIIINRDNAREPRVDRLFGVIDPRLRLRLRGGIVPRFKQRDQRAGDHRRALQRIGDGLLAIALPGLAQIAEQGAQQRDRWTRQAGRDDQLVERVIFGNAVEHCGNGFFDRRAMAERRIGAAPRVKIEQKAVNMADSRRAERGRGLFDDAESEILEHRHRIGERKRRACENLEPEPRRRVVGAAEQPHLAITVMRERIEAQYVARGFRRIIFGAIGKGKSAGVAQREPRRV